MRTRLVPVFFTEANRKNWITRVLRVFAWIQLIIIFLILQSSSYSFWLRTIVANNFATLDNARIIADILSRITGLVVGFIGSMTTWAVAMILDDIHATRLMVSGYIASQDDDDRNKP